MVFFIPTINIQFVNPHADVHFPFVLSRSAFHGRIDILVSQQRLNRPDVITVFQQVRRKGMSKGVTAGCLMIPAFNTASRTARCTSVS
jgi:hypothetical protein